MKKLKKAGVFALLLLCFALIPAISANAGFRRVKVKENGKIKCYYRYYTSANRYLKGVKTSNVKTAYKRWTFKNFRVNGRVYTYCFNEKGYLLTGWHRLTTKACNGKWYWYYFDSNGRMFKNRTKNGHYLQGNGRMLVNGWHGGVYYGSDGSVVVGYNPDAANGFEQTKAGTKYMQADGTYAEKKWLCIKDSQGKYYWYYFYSNGIMAKNTWVGSRHVDESGHMDSLRMY